MAELTFAAALSGLLLGLFFGWSAALNRADIMGFDKACEAPAAYFSTCYRDD